MPPPANPGLAPDCVPSAPTPVAVSVIDYEFPLNERTRTLRRLEDNEGLMSIRQRSNIPGGVCEFDLPSYHYWQHRPAADRRADLDQWIAPFLPLRDSLAIVLRILRDSGKSAQRLAEGGVFQQMLAGRAVQLVRVRVGAGIPCVPEVSANRYMLNIRFVQHDGPTGRSKGLDSDIPFDLTFCNL